MPSAREGLYARLGRFHRRTVPDYRAGTVRPPMGRVWLVSGISTFITTSGGGSPMARHRGSSRLKTAEALSARLTRSNAVGVPECRTAPAIAPMGRTTPLRAMPANSTPSCQPRVPTPDRHPTDQVQPPGCMGSPARAYKTRGLLCDTPGCAACPPDLIRENSPLTRQGAPTLAGAPKASQTTEELLAFSRFRRKRDALASRCSSLSAYGRLSPRAGS